MACAAPIIIGIIARANWTQIGFSGATEFASGATVPRRIVSVRRSKWRMNCGAPRNSIALPRYAGDCFARNIAVSGVASYASPVFVRNPLIVSVSHRMRMPRSDALQRSAISRTVCAPAAIALNTSSSIAAFSAAVR